MRSLVEFFFLVDVFITNTLQKFCWWTDKKYGKDNVWWSKITIAIFFPTTETIASYFFWPNENNTSMGAVFITFFLFAWIISYFFYFFSSSTRSIVENAKEIPNRNKTHFFVLVFKGSILFASIFFSVFPTVGLLNPNSTTAFVFPFFLSAELVLYFLCTEIRPTIKTCWVVKK